VFIEAKIRKLLSLDEGEREEKDKTSFETNFLRNFYVPKKWFVRNQSLFLFS
jgi:hypothetical protein